MKKTIFTLMLVFTIMFSMTLSTANSPMSCYSTSMLKSAPNVYIVGPTPEPYKGYNDTNGKYYLRVRESKLIHGPADDDPIVKYKPFGILYRSSNFTGTLGETISISHSVSKSVSNTNSVSVSMGISSPTGFSRSVTAQHSTTITKSIGSSITKTYSSGYSYGFPLSTAPANCTKAEAGVGFQFATYRSIIDVKKLVTVSKKIKVKYKRYVNECSICKKNEGKPGHNPAHFHDGLVGWRLYLQDGTTVEVEEMFKDSLVKDGTIDKNMTYYKKPVKEWKYETITGNVKVPIETLVNIYYDAKGNIIDKNGNIVN
ncbi:hypothetical protein PV797_11915 [Clostridiaceae bacterium M8S5]|nr:hypothetical protein PV797_11915 [Clostridiaceae bacterium M8S5]